ncbi:MAG TPA: hypothetical protein IAA98_14660 [Candidatus Avipropionibacterium avicola]|uniref:CT398-like coiled coil hairpin domain-containing protein n=1 Tax=Candidatus Avipropionibacterium avicola TaxID=2840701 RepID=A0A9D1KPW2_9ACTN|nr:hypothetical protein [Candidatus Avipropionibacterium avicola]
MGLIGGLTGEVEARHRARTPCRRLSPTSAGEGPAIKATPADQQQLLELQAIDTALDQLRHRRSHLPEQADLAAIAKEHAAAAEELVAAETQVSDLDLAVGKAEEDLVPVRERRERDARRIEDGSIGDPKALATMIEEVEHLTRRIAKLEDIQLEVMEEHEQAVSVRDRLARHKSELATRGIEATRRRDEVVTEIDAEVATRTAERETAAAAVPASLLELYERTRSSRGGVAAVALVQKRCTGCLIEANAADLRAYATAAEDEVLRCEECSRILVRTKESGL